MGAMKPLDYLKAAGLAILILIINVLIAIVVVLIYSFAIEPGHNKEFYDAAALRIAPWCSHIAGTALFFIAGYYFARRNPSRNPFLFAVTVTVFYFVIDASSVAFRGIFNLQFGLSMVAKLLAALAGAFLAARRQKSLAPDQLPPKNLI
jgi:hypothetical protein